MNDETIKIPEKGELIVPMTNDYLFKMLMQENNNVLKALVQDLLRLEDGDITSIVITNPIKLGDYVNDKTIILDINATMNDYSSVNLEMQVVNENDWPERSLYYLCDEYQNLNKGDNYTEVKPVYHIGILDFTVFPKHPEFYATYRMMNEKNHHVYSRKMQLSVLDLTQTDIATEEDIGYHLDIWARLFKAKTWEEMHMLSQELPIIEDVSETVYKVTAEEKARREMFARQDYIRRTNDAKIFRERLEKQLAEKDLELAEANSEIERLKELLAKANISE